ncbi:MAG TPA: RNA 2',3'-cyclic phosphodiesterase [Candidatus Limnocylindria bacterium]|nr:RNA 2',3'-cyclic phosphodiesterase [Candidatus Limnocylindria bacterium]
MRLFIAVALPTELSDRAAGCLPPALPALRPVRPELLHVTLAFLGWVADGRLEAATDAARAAAAGHSPFDLSFDHAGRFPATGRPRAIWLGIGAGKAELTRLATDTAEELRRRSFALEDRAFALHLTLARIRADASGPESRTIAAAVDALTVPELRTRVDRIAVVESELSPKGPRYTTRAEAPLV